MKYIFLLFISAGIFMSAVNAQNRYSIFAGPQMTTASYKVNGVKQDASPKIGLQLGGGMKVPFDKKLYFSPAILYSLKGYKVTLKTPSTLPDIEAVNNNTSVHSIELAFLLQYVFSENPGHFYIKAGPSLDFALFGHEKFDKQSGGTVSRSMKFSFNDYGHYLASGILQFGYETAKGTFFFVGYNGSLGTISNREDGPVIKHRMVGISIGKYIK